jgi:ATP-binding cassette subfamily B protein
MQSRTCTVIVIAHRLSTVRDADIIAMCSDGEVLDAAPHEILMQRCEAYQKLVSRQLSSTNYGSNASLTSLAKGDEKEAY